MSTGRTGGRRGRLLAIATIASVAVLAAGTAVHAVPPVPPDPPADVTVECAADVPAPVDLTATDTEDGDITVSPVDVVTPGASTHEFVVTRTWTFEDSDKETASVSQTITVADTEAPTGTAPPNLTVVGVDQIPTAETLTGTDTCDGDVESAIPVDVTDPSPVVDPDDQVITRSWTFTDEAGNTSDPVTQTITVIPTAADLAITVTPGDDPAAAGDQLVYTVRVENLGPDTATDVTVTAPAFTAPAAGATFDDTTGCDNSPSGLTLSCELGELPSGQTSTVEVTIDVPLTATGSISQTWTVAADPAVPDDDDTNNAVTTETATTTLADLSVITGVAEAPTTSTSVANGQLVASALAADDAVTTTITIDNAGPSNATNVAMTATFTSAITELTVVDSGIYTCSLTAAVLTCTVASHPADATASIVVSGILTSTATGTAEIVTVGVLSDTTDPLPTNNSTRATVTITDDSTATTSTTIADSTTTTAATTTTIETTTTAATTTVAAVVPTTAAPASGAPLPATGSDSNNVVRASIIVLLAGLAAVLIARRRPDLVASLRPANWGGSAPAALPTRRVSSNGVSTVIEEPVRRPKP